MVFDFPEREVALISIFSPRSLLSISNLKVPSFSKRTGWRLTSKVAVGAVFPDIKSWVSEGVICTSRGGGATKRRYCLIRYPKIIRRDREIAVMSVARGVHIGLPDREISCFSNSLGLSGKSRLRRARVTFGSTPTVCA